MSLKGQQYFSQIWDETSQYGGYHSYLVCEWEVRIFASGLSVRSESLFSLFLLIPVLITHSTGLLKKKYTLSKIYFTKITDAKSMSCVRIERKSLKVLIWISRQVRTQ
jgi:hypothetical protein